MFRCCSYLDIDPKAGDVVYADPPYSNTTGYGGAFDSGVFWDIMRWWRITGVKVFVSEYNAPPDWRVIWEKPIKRNMKADFQSTVCVTEKLFI